MMNKIGLYIHIPFCRHICPYCDFYKMVASQDLQNAYVQALCEEMNLKKLNNYSFKCVYIGGGTPSYLSIQNLTILFNNLNQLIKLEDLEEFSFECNPEDITDELLSLLKKYHVNRLSIGVQSLNQQHQKLLNRRISYEELQNKISLLRNHSFTNFNIDLIYGMINQTKEDLSLDIDRILALSPTHISIYSLMVESHTIFGYRKSKGEILELSEDLEADLYYFIIDKLATNSYIQYETSNFAIKGYESRHNLIYWNDDEYIALGAGASSYINKKRILTVPNIKQYIERLKLKQFPIEQVEQISPSVEMDEYLMLGLRKTQGISCIDFKRRFNVCIEEEYPNIKKVLEDGLLIKNNDYITIKKEYRYIANYIIVKIYN